MPNIISVVGIARKLSLLASERLQNGLWYGMSLLICEKRVHDNTSSFRRCKVFMVLHHSACYFGLAPKSFGFLSEVLGVE